MLRLAQRLVLKTSGTERFGDRALCSPPDCLASIDGDVFPCKEGERSSNLWQGSTNKPV